MHTKEIERHWWTIPADRTKNGKAHRVYLSELAREIIGQTGVADGYLFESPRGGKPMDENAMGHALRRCLKGYAPKKPKNEPPRKGIKVAVGPSTQKLDVDCFCPHDLRRTARTHMSRLGILSDHAERVLNHLPSDVRKHYDIYSYDREKKSALILWGHELKRLISGQLGYEKVVSIA